MALKTKRGDANVQYRYGSLRIFPDRRVRLSARTIPNLPQLDFSAHYMVDPGERAVSSESEYTIYARCPGNSSFFILYLSRHRVQSACFNYGLSPDDLRKGVSLLRQAGGGIEQWIIPGLEWTQGHLAWYGARYPEMLQIIPELLEANRDLPVAKRWLRLRKDYQRTLELTAGSAAAKKRRR
jgi:hypothetical protein